MSIEPCRYTPELRQLKAQGRRLERLHLKTGFLAHKEMYADHMKKYKATLSTAKSNHYSNLMTSSEGNVPTLFSVMNNFLQPADPLPSHLHSTALCNVFFDPFVTQK